MTDGSIKASATMVADRPRYGPGELEDLVEFVLSHPDAEISEIEFSGDSPDGFDSGTLQSPVDEAVEEVVEAEAFVLEEVRYSVDYEADVAE